MSTKAPNQLINRTDSALRAPAAGYSSRWIMRLLDNSRTTLLGWTPLIVLGLFLGLDLAMRAYSPMLFCTPINVGAKELMRGFEHSTPLVQTTTVFSFVLYFGALALAASEALKRNLSIAGVLALRFRF